MGIPENDAEEAQHARDVDLPPAAEADQRRATEAAAAQDEEVVDGQPVDEQEVCALCGGVFPTPAAENHSEEECRAAREVQGGAPVADVSPEVRVAVQEALDDALGSAEMVVANTRDQHEGMVAMDAHDAARFVGGLVEQAQNANLGKRWVYRLPGGGGEGLTVDAVEDITQQMNWTGRCAISLMPETLDVEVIQADEGNGLEPFWVATVFAVDERTGQKHAGTSMEPQMMKLKPDTAAKKREKGAVIGTDNKVFDRFSRAKAINKAGRNAEEKHIPEVVKVTLIAMAANKPEMVERIRTPIEEKLDALPPPLDTDEARQVIKECEEVYEKIKPLGGGRGRVEITPARFNGALVTSQHNMTMLRATKAWLDESLVKLTQKLGEEVPT